MANNILISWHGTSYHSFSLFFVLYIVHTYSYNQVTNVNFKLKYMKVFIIILQRIAACILEQKTNRTKK